MLINLYQNNYLNSKEINNKRRVSTLLVNTSSALEIITSLPLVLLDNFLISSLKDLSLHFSEPLLLDLSHKSSFNFKNSNTSRIQLRSSLSNYDIILVENRSKTISN